MKLVVHTLLLRVRFQASGDLVLNWVIQMVRIYPFFFISTGHIRYQASSPGYVFNVSTGFNKGDSSTQYYRNIDEVVRPVACIDS